MKFFYDLHFHSCLSPCGSEDMTPANLAGMCKLAGLDVVALTDHNTTGNCAAFCLAAERHGLLALPGMELCTQEDVHIICLFPNVDAAERFSAHVASRLPTIRNKPDIFGLQTYMDEGDLVLGQETAFLAGSTDIAVSDAAALVSSFGGLAYPAHIDRPSYALLTVLGLWEPAFGFPLAELSTRCPPHITQRPDLAGVRFVRASDAHYLDQVLTANHAMELDELSPGAVLHWLAHGSK